MYEEFNHYHCSICGERYPQKEEAKQCLWNHSELEILRWIACELIAAYHFAEIGGGTPRREEMAFSWDFLKELNERFQIAEIDENGWVWSLAIKENRV